MSYRLNLSIATLGLLSSWGALADDHCTDPVADWQPKETLQKQVEQYGWKVQRIKVDDGCYEIRGLDRNGNELEAKFTPAKLQLRSLELEFGPDANTSDYLPKAP